MFKPAAPYRNLLPNLSVADIANPYVVVGPGLVSISPAFRRSIASHPAGPHGRLSKKNGNRAPIAGAGGVDTICTGFVIPLSQLHRV